MTVGLSLEGVDVVRCPVCQSDKSVPVNDITQWMGVNVCLGCGSLYAPLGDNSDVLECCCRERIETVICPCHGVRTSLP